MALEQRDVVVLALGHGGHLDDGLLDGVHARYGACVAAVGVVRCKARAEQDRGFLGLREESEQLGILGTEGLLGVRKLFGKGCLAARFDSLRVLAIDDLTADVIDTSHELSFLQDEAT